MDGLERDRFAGASAGGAASAEGPAGSTGAAIARLRRLRLVDVVDALDYLGHRDLCLVSHEIRPVFNGAKMCGPARTALYGPTGRALRYATPEEYERIRQEWYDQICPIFVFDDVQEGDVLVYDTQGVEAGFWGSCVNLTAMEKKVGGVVIDGGCRDRREVEMAGLPVFARAFGRTEVIGRLEFRAKDVPVTIGGVQVNPGDVVFGDDDGVAVIPRRLVAAVAPIAESVLAQDKRTRGQYYRKLGIPLDDTVV